jgi:Ca-activated chloride channel family protein
MEWQHPEWLYGILPLGVLWLAIALESRRRRRRAAASFVARAMWPRILPAESAGRFWAKTLLREAALVLGLIALAGPRFGTYYEDVLPRGSDLYVLIDVSRSMLAEDVPPSRLGRARADVAALVNRLEGERIGLIAFAGRAVVACPLTVDYDAFRRSLDELDPDSAPRGGTAIGDAIRKALEVFQARGDRDQAILLITDGDDQQSYPREAAALAAERRVTIFTVGLGDAETGARIPQKGGDRSFVEYQGNPVWSKLDGSLLKEIALKTAGVYVPVGTRAYDLGELYAKYLQARRVGDEAVHRRLRRAERFQVFLALAVLALLADAFLRPYPGPRRGPAREPNAGARGRAAAGAGIGTGTGTSTGVTALALLATLAGNGRAADPADAVREGLRLYGRGEFARAGESFASAREQLERGRRDAGKAAVAAFDQACAAHRKGDVAQARQWYLKAGLAPDRRLAAAAHFNLGTLAAEEARRLAGDHPEGVAAEKRPEILEQLKAAVAAFRHCLELQPEDESARRDIELVRQWIKYYSDRWQAGDRERRRRETNLLAFLEYLIQAQSALRESVQALTLTATAPADAFAERKRVQEELYQELAPLREKIQAELDPRPPAGAGAGKASPGPSREQEQAIALLQGWADAAGQRMSSATHHLDGRRAAQAAADEQSAIDELVKIWEAVIPFAPLLARDLADQTSIARSLEPGTGTAGTEDLTPLAEAQERTWRRTQLLKLKAEAKRARLQEPPSGGAEPRGGAADPKQVDAGYQKAIELAPRAAGAMERAAKPLRRQDRPAAYPPADEARQILEEIQKAQPRNESKEPDPKEKEDPPKQDQEQKKEESDRAQQPEPKSKQDPRPSDPSDATKKEARPPEPLASRDQVEAALRKVRERQQEKRERDRVMKARVSGRVPVEKDW